MNDKYSKLFASAAARLAAAGVESSDYELRLLLAAAMGVDSLCLNDIPNAEQTALFEQMLQKRLQHMPVDKILGHRGFYKYDFKVNTDVLSPRPDTETLLEEALDCIKADGAATVLELGVGSGCIITSLLAETPSLQGTGVDISAPALRVARQNADMLGVMPRLKLLNASWFDADFLSLFSQRFDIIVSNPPYIPSAEIPSLEEDVKNYDPLPALDGGSDGLDSYRRIAELAPRLLTEQGRILLEVGENQAHDVAAIFVGAGLKLAKIRNDLSGIERCVSLKK